MIGKLRGIVDEQGAGTVVIDVGGVGYVVQCSGRTLGRLPRRGEAASLLIETQVREDAISLYGFGEEAERGWFRLLVSVQGVGAKVALSLLSALDPLRLAAAIASKDRGALTEADGVGPKLATRILSELQDKVGAVASGTPEVPVDDSGILGGVEGEAVSALVNLGYRRIEAYGAVTGVRRKLGDAATLDALIRAGLKELSP